MIHTRKIKITVVMSILLTIVALLFVVGRVKAETFPDYTFRISAQKIKDGTEYELKSSAINVSVVADGWAAPSTVKWTNSEPGVVKLNYIEGTPHTVNLVRQGPGFSTIVAEITQGGFTYTISFLVRVGLGIDYNRTGTKDATTNHDQILIMNSIGESKPIYLKYADYGTETGTEIVNSAVTFTSSNEGVVSVDENGLVKAKGAGSSTITITSDTMSSKDRPMEVELIVVVKPNFELVYMDGGNTNKHLSSDSNIDGSGVYNGIPSNFIIDSNANYGTDLEWVIYHVVDKKKTKITNNISKHMEYSINDDGTVTFSKVKAGTYEIYAFTNKKFDENTKAPYAYMKIYVPIDFSDVNIVMNVGDTYDIIANSNIPSKDVFLTPTGYDYNVVKLDPTSFVLSAQRKGQVKIKLVYDTGQKLFEGIIIPDMEITVTVIDGISLNTTSATLFTKGTLQLEAFVTDNTVPIVWSSNDPSIAKVDNGLVTAASSVKGEKKVTITASQTINGVVKKATCEITVQQSVSGITVDPKEVTLDLNAYKTLHATIAPDNLIGVKLQWKSSNESIVKIVESSALTVTIQGVGGGHAVISAINQDNVVVGYSAITVLQPVTTVTLSETAATLDLSVKYLQLRASVSPVNAVNKDVTWSTTDSTKATVNANGLVTLLRPGTVTIIATSKDNPAAVAYCNLNIQVPVTSVSLDESNKTMYVGQTARLTYLVNPTNASNNSVIWTSTNTSVATVDATGKVTAKSVGTAVIILKSVNGGNSVYCTITVKQVATGIKFDVAQLNLKTGEVYNINVSLTPKNSTDVGIVWNSSDTKVATVDAYGKVIAKNAGTTIIMARTEAGGVAYCRVTVTQAVKGLILNFSEKTIFKGGEFTLDATINPSTATMLDVTWKSSNTKIATVSNKGVVKGLEGGVAVITCTSVDGGFSATCVVTVKESVSSIKLNYDTYNLGVKKTVMLVATVTNETATNQKVTWKSSNSKIATVNQKGKVTGIKAGYATITAIAQDGSEVEASCEIRVVKPVTSISLSRSTITMFVGDSKKITATVRPTSATIKTAKWSSSDESVAIVDVDGTVIAMKAGNTIITAEAMDSSGKKSICYVTVYDRVASTGITLQDKKLTMVRGESKIVPSVKIPSNSTDGVTWSTDNAAVASVNKKTGRITAKSTGVAYISAMTESGKTATVEVIVIGLNVSKLETEQYTTYNQALSVEGATGSVTWRVDNPLVAVVYSDGTVSTRGVGTATITATVNGRKLTCKITVKKMQ